MKGMAEGNATSSGNVPEFSGSAIPTRPLWAVSAALKGYFDGP
jgi:hypothetical protein